MYIYPTGLLMLSLMLGPLLLAFPSAANADAYDDALGATREGHLREATTLFKLASDQATTNPMLLRALWGLADVYRQQGKNNAALETLQRVAALASSEDASAATQLRLGGVYFGLGRYAESDAALSQAKALEARLRPGEQIALLLDLGNLQVERGTFAKAVDYYDAAAIAAKQVDRADLEARARLNALRAKLDGKDLSGFESQLEQVEPIILKIKLAHTRRPLYLSLGDIYRRGIAEFGYPEGWSERAYRAFDNAMLGTQSPAELGYANGFMGRLYEDFERYDEALSLTRKAIFYAQQASADEQVYRWEWQAGRILLATGRIEDAQGAYQRAVYQLDKVKPNFALGSRRTFNQLVSPVYTQYADVMLRRTSAMPTGDDQQQHLSNVRDLLETLKAAEVEDYFANECVAKIRAEDAVSVADSGAAIIYPVFLDDRTEILVEAGGELAQFTTPIGLNQMTATIRRLRINLERSTSGTAYLRPARQLHDWLIAPAQAFIDSANVDTLVMVPEGALRTIPISTLHNGEQFLVERYALATTPGIQLTKQLKVAENESLLVGGLTKSVQGFSELPNVQREIDTISSIYPATTISDAAFQLQTVESELEAGGYSIAHFATHGEFNQDHSKSFILTYDDKLTLDGLQQVLGRRDQAEPLDLLVLSACKTAAGDDRAALGLAGVAVQSGAQSALASLWYISDAATAQLIETFYTALHTSRNSKAESLRIAQLALLNSDQFQHPSFWAPYLLVGNWL
ncbi:MAG: CHAT domain-containing protein [Gammaproteobacteria bacterium]|nr:CHAT domain-containing protein [Gammaproteobacteria bacterium]